MNDWEKQKLREHWQKPGKLKALLEVLPMVPHNTDGGWYKKVVWMTGITFEPTDMAQVYYMLEEDGVLVREDVQPEPAAHVECTHTQSGDLCHQCRFENTQRGWRAALRYRLAKDLASY